MTVQPIAYLSFNGTCKEAMTFYSLVLDGTINTMLAASQTPCAQAMPDVSENFIVNSQLELPDGGLLMAGDHPPHLGPYPGMQGFMMTLNYRTVDEASRRFAALSEGGTVQMPLQATFWAKIWGMCTDKFGTPWVVNGELIPVDQGAVSLCASGTQPKAF